jgi:hypothetical protein
MLNGEVALLGFFQQPNFYRIRKYVQEALIKTLCTTQNSFQKILTDKEKTSVGISR